MQCRHEIKEDSNISRNLVHSSQIDRFLPKNRKVSSEGLPSFGATFDNHHHIYPHIESRSNQSANVANLEETLTFLSPTEDNDDCNNNEIGPQIVRINVPAVTTSTRNSDTNNHSRVTRSTTQERLQNNQGNKRRRRTR